MGKLEKLLEDARNAPQRLRFSDAILLAEAHGFTHARTNGSHTMFKRPGYPKLLNFQNVRGVVPTYQAKQLLAAIDSLAEQLE